MLPWITAALSLLAFDSPATVVLDRIAVVVGRRVIKTSDIDRDLRLTAFLNREPLVMNAVSKKKAADRLVDQQIIREEIATGEYARASDGDAAALLNKIRSDRFAGSDPRMRAELSRYGLTEPEIQGELLWQLTVLKFIDERFLPGVLISDTDIQKYYDEHLAELKRQYPRNYTLTALEPKIRQLLEGQQTNQQFETWLDEARKQTSIKFHEEALK